MERIGVSFTYKLLLPLLLATALFGSLVIAPIHASALEISSQTAQLLPPGANTCAPATVSNFTPYLYGGALDSFEFTINDPSYVAVIGSVGQTSIPLMYMTRMSDPSGGVRIHVDINSTPVTGTLPLTVTLLSAKTGAPVCMTVVTMSVGSGPVQTVSSPTTYTPPTSPVVSMKPAPKPVGEPIAPSTPSSTSATSAALVAAPIAMSPVRGLCESQASAYGLWLVLLVLFAIVTGILLWAEFPLSWSWAQAPERVATIILALLLLLLGFWYFSPGCRAALWMPLVAFLIAVLGLLAAFWNHPKITGLFLAEEKTSVIITPPPAQKKEAN